MSHTITAVIPTKNRRDDLLVAVESIMSQLKMPDELIIIDQSNTDVSQHEISSICKNTNYRGLIYVYDPKVRGLVHAKKVACDIAKSDLICFLEDDIKLENDYFAEIKNGFIQNKNMMGCSGVITNPLPRTKVHKFIFHMFHRGLFKDIRFDYYGTQKKSAYEYILSNKISGGLSAWRKEVFSAVQFDESNNLFMLEDIDFSMRVDEKFKNSLYINPGARLEHFWSPVNRDKELIRYEKKITENFIFFRGRPKTVVNYCCFSWLLFGFFIESAMLSAIGMTIVPLRLFLTGAVKGLSKL